MPYLYRIKPQVNKSKCLLTVYYLNLVFFCSLGLAAQDSLYYDSLYYGQPHPVLEQAAAAILEEGIAAKAFPGAQLLVARKGEIMLHLTAGYHTYERLQAVQRTDIYDLASITKASTALLVLMQQYEQGKLDLDAPLASLFPLLEKTNKAAIPLRAALAHQARLRPWVPYWQSSLRGNARYPWQAKWNGQQINEGAFKKRSLRKRPHRNYPLQLTDSLWAHRGFRERYIYRAIRKSPLETEAQYKYSGLLFYLLPDYVERSTGQAYTAYLQQQFYAPLGTQTLTYRPLDKGFPLSRIVPSEQDTFFRQQLLQGIVHDEGAALMGGISANAGLFSNAIDLATLWQMLLNGGSYQGRRYFQPATVKTFTTVQFPQYNNHRGLGFDKPLLQYDVQSSSVAASASAASFGHSGYTGTFVWADPEHDLLFIFLSNRVHPSRNSRAIYTLNIRPRLMTLVYAYLGIRAEETTD